MCVGCLPIRGMMVQGDLQDKPSNDISAGIIMETPDIYFGDMACDEKK